MNRATFLKKSCSPFSSQTVALSNSVVTQYLSELEGWVQKGLTIQKNYVFRDFKNAVSFVNQVAQLAEQEDHHPDIGIYYNKIILTLWTHTVKGLTENDFILAAKIDAIQ
jgi:4a-hydroxytetrahydrobiopterin dehydratase